MIALSIDARPRDLGGFTVRRLLPSPRRRLVGPFTFFDHIGPATFSPDQGVDVRPHPHIGLATVTYLFEGELVHKDSLGSDLPIRPGAVNWMLAGRGVVHSERTASEVRRSGANLHGIQAWVALPAGDEELPPAFEHHPADAVPAWETPGVRLRLIAGSAYGHTSPVGVRSPMFYVEAHLDAGAVLALPAEHAERAIYVVSGRVAIATSPGMAPGTEAEPGRMLVCAPADAVPVELRALEPSHVMLLGGAPLDGPRFIWWNFVSSRQDRIEEAAREWREGRYVRVPGDEVEFTPAPSDGPSFPR